MKHQNSTLVSCFMVFAMLMTGCGSGSSTNTGSNINGVFADAPVAGVSYSCGGKQGVTGTGGTFTCPANSTVTFSVGAITLCSAAPAQAFMTLVSCAQATNPAANTSTPAVLALAQFLISISTTPASSGGLTVTAAELQAAVNVSLTPSTATQAQLQAAVSAVSPGATLVSVAAAQTELNSTVLGGAAGSYSGTYAGTGGDSGTWTATLAASGSVTGTFADIRSGNGNVSGAFVNGTQYQGTAGTATWTGSMDTSVTPHVFSGTFSSSSPSVTGTFTGHN